MGSTRHVSKRSASASSSARSCRSRSAWRAISTSYWTRFQEVLYYGLFDLEPPHRDSILLLPRRRSDADGHTMGAAGAAGRAGPAQGQNPAPGSTAHALGHPLAA